MNRKILITLIIVSILLLASTAKISKKSKEPKHEKVNIEKQKKEINLIQLFDEESKVKAPKHPKEEKVKPPKEAKVKQPKEEKIKLPKEEKVKQPKEEKIKLPKEKKVKTPKVQVPRNFTSEVISKVAKFTFWNGIVDNSFERNVKHSGLKKKNCFINQYNKLSVVPSGPKNLCLINQYDPTFDNEWQNWIFFKNIFNFQLKDTNSTIESGKFRFFNNGTNCQQEFNWKISEPEINGLENGQFNFLSSPEKIEYSCSITGHQSQNQTNKWNSSITYSMQLQGEKRGEIFEKSYYNEIEQTKNNIESTSFNEYFENTILLTQNKTIQDKEYTLSSKGENKISRGTHIHKIYFNGNTTQNEQKWNKSKTLFDFVENHSEGQRFGSEHSKVTSDTEFITTSGIVIKDIGTVSERSRKYYMQKFGSNSNNIEYTDIGNDRKWKNDILRPNRNNDYADNWNESGVYVIPTPPHQSNNSTITNTESSLNNFLEKQIE